MLYQLPTGKAIEISTEQFFSMSDDELEYLIAYNYGDVIENPWHGSMLSKRDNTVPDEIEEKLKDLTDLSSFDKLNELDIDYPEE